MGAAKRRGTLEQRIAQSVERQKIEDAARHAKYQREEAERRARLSALPPQERREAVLAGRRTHRSRLMLATALGVAAPYLALSSALDDIHHGDTDG